MGNSFDDSRAGKVKRGTLLGFREERHPEISCVPPACAAAGAA
jgi:hypothetical protein